MIKTYSLSLPVTATEEEAKAKLIKKSGLKNSQVKFFKFAKKSIDARDKKDVRLVYSAYVSNKEEIFESELIIPRPEKKPKIVVVGFGPAGIFCGLYLARAGLEPTIIERGLDVDERKKSVNKFINDKKLDENSNIQFGEGGAGTFSDGKLNTGINGKWVRTVLSDFVRYGAPEEIEWESKPHIGSDKLPFVVKNMRKEIERLGGKVLFSTKMEAFSVKNFKITSVVTDKGEIYADEVVLAVGHSARDIFTYALKSGISMEPKAFAMGYRIEHLQSDISLSQYGEKFAPLLPPADYRLASRKGNRGVFTFCMCPGGFVMPSASEEGGVVTNGMSLYARSGMNANSALLCEIYPSDTEGVLGGMELQRKIERSAFLVGGDYSAPIQTVGDFLSGKVGSVSEKVVPTYGAGTVYSDLTALYPDFVAENIKIGIKDMATRLKCFDDSEAILTGVETRSSSPVRILRGENFSSLTYSNLYPCGEGCGYAGGITSAAADGIKVALAIIEKYVD